LIGFAFATKFQESANAFGLAKRTEERLFSDNADEWLCRTDGIAIEIRGRRAHEIVYDATLRHDFAAEVDHNLHYFTRRKVIE
jgi:hypothetical protein